MEPTSMLLRNIYLRKIPGLPIQCLMPALRLPRALSVLSSWFDQVTGSCKSILNVS